MFFSVKNAIKIGGRVFKPCICYEVTDYIALTIKRLVAEGKITLYPERVFFCNGKIVEKKPVVKEILTTEKHKKEKKVKEPEEAHLEEITEETDTESEGF